MTPLRWVAVAIGIAGITGSVAVGGWLLLAWRRSGWERVPAITVVAIVSRRITSICLFLEILLAGVG